jgi:hypothetical protein
MLLFCTPTLSQTLWQHGPLKISPNQHYLQFTDGTPFFWLGDTGWELFHRLNLTEANEYLSNRSLRGFNVIQAVILAEFDGLRKPNRNGDIPFYDLNPEKPNENYFLYVDSVIHLAKEKNLFMGLLPTWGDKVTQLWGEGPVVFNQSNAFNYGLFLGNRYKNEPNIIWILGGDRPAKNDSADWRPIWTAMAKGIQQGTNNNAIFSYHPWGGDYSTTQFMPDEKWLDINMFQSGHGGGHDVPTWELVDRDRKILPIKPTLDGEPNYEDHPVNPWPTWNPANGYYDDYDVRKQCYRSVFAGACGVTYGHHSVWQFYSEREPVINFAKMYWQQAITRPGATQVGYLKKLMECRPMLNRIPDDNIIVSGQGTKEQHMVAFRAEDGSFGMVYLPIGKPITIDLSFIQQRQIHAWWFNPKNAAVIDIGKINRNKASQFTPPSNGIGNDWVLVLDEFNNTFSMP